MENKMVQYLSLARKGGRAELGEEPTAEAARAGKAALIIVAEDASDHTWRRAKSLVAGTNQQCARIPASKDTLGSAVGREVLSIAAITDPALALALLNAAEDSAHYATQLEALSERVKRGQQRRAETKAHVRNVRRGGKSMKHSNGGAYR